MRVRSGRDNHADYQGSEAALFRLHRPEPHGAVERQRSLRARAAGGALLIAKTLDVKDRINSALIAIPGKYTTANFLCSLAFPVAQNKVEMVFNEIEDAILRGGQIETRATAQSGGTDKMGVDAGVIIHENRFTYQNKGLVKLLDLGEYWETTTGMPIPLGGIVIRRDISLSLQKKIQRILRRSVEFAFKNPESSKNFIAKYAQEMEESVRQQHINLYVNQYSLELGETGRAAVKFLFETAYQKKITDTYTSDIFVK